MIKQTHSLIILLFGFLTACSTISKYDQAAYEHATSVKVDTLALIEKATGSYGNNASEITKVNLALQKAYEYDKGRPLNSETAKQWEILLVENKNHPEYGIIPRFFDLWKRKGSLPQVKISNEKQSVSDSFDTIIQLESGKIHS